MAELRTILERHFFEDELSPVVPYVFNIVGGVHTTFESSCFIWRYNYSVAKFTDLRELIKELLKRRYNSEFTSLTMATKEKA
jgi:hypothetical protein